MPPASPLRDKTQQQYWPIHAAGNMASNRLSLGHLQGNQGCPYSTHADKHTRNVPSHWVTGCVSLRLSAFSKYFINAVKQLWPTMYLQVVLVVFINSFICSKSSVKYSWVSSKTFGCAGFSPHRSEQQLVWCRQTRTDPHCSSLAPEHISTSCSSQITSTWNRFQTTSL